MKIYILAALSGASGISGGRYLPSTRESRADLTAEARKLLAGDVNACVESCVQAGAGEIIVRDCDGDGFNLTRSGLHPAADLISGHVPGTLLPDIEGSDAMLMIGFSALPGTRGYIGTRTLFQPAVQNLFLNGRKAGGIGFFAAAAAEKGIPVVMVSGDDKACKEGTEWIPGVTVCPVKTGLSENGALLLPLESARELIRSETRKALKQIPAKIPEIIRHPVKLRIEYTYCDAAQGTTAQPDSRICETSADTLEEAWFISR